MHALVAAPGTPAGIALRQVPDPIPGPQQAVVAMRAFTINAYEPTLVAASPGGFRPGWDIAGEVVHAATDGPGPIVGTRVVGLGAGTWAERIAVDAADLAPLPDAVSFAAAATLSVVGLTALRTLGAGGALLGKRVLITAATGGVGRYLVQLAHHAGAHVTAAGRRPEAIAGLRALGADTGVAMDALGGLYDLVLESLGGAVLAAALGAVAPGGTVVSFGNGTRQPATVDVTGFYLKHGARLVAFVIQDSGHPYGPDLGYLAALLGAGILTPPPSGYEGGWRQAGDVLAALRAGEIAGKAVLTVD
jgi:NADPH2:quinone reductase